MGECMFYMFNWMPNALALKKGLSCVVGKSFIWRSRAAEQRLINVVFHVKMQWKWPECIPAPPYQRTWVKSIDEPVYTNAHVSMVLDRRGTPWQRGETKTQKWGRLDETQRPHQQNDVCAGGRRPDSGLHLFCRGSDTRIVREQQQQQHFVAIEAIKVFQPTCGFMGVSTENISSLSHHPLQTVHSVCFVEAVLTRTQHWFVQNRRFKVPCFANEGKSGR